MERRVRSERRYGGARNVVGDRAGNAARELFTIARRARRISFQSASHYAVSERATDSEALKTILSGVNGMAKKSRFVETAGTKWICFIPGIRDCRYSEETFKKVLVDGSGVELPWNGVVETKAANSTDIPDPIATSFPLSHIDLQCSDDSIKWVGKQLQ